MKNVLLLSGYGGAEEVYDVELTNAKQGQTEINEKPQGN